MSLAGLGSFIHYLLLAATPWRTDGCALRRVGKLGANLEKRSQGHLVLIFSSVWQFKVKEEAELVLFVVKGLSQSRVQMELFPVMHACVPQEGQLELSCGADGDSQECRTGRLNSTHLYMVAKCVAWL